MNKNCFYGLGFVAGDLVVVSTRPDVVGNIQWIEEGSGLISVRFSDYSYSIINKKNITLVERQGGFSTLFPPKKINRLYKKLSVVEKLYFWYNKGKSIQQISKASGYPENRIREAIKKRLKERIYEKPATFKANNKK